MESINHNGIIIYRQAEERYVFFNHLSQRGEIRQYCLYGYRDTDGEFFSTVAHTLEQCRNFRDVWLYNKLYNEQ